MIRNQNKYLLNLLLYNEKYRKHYVLYKARVEKRYLPKKLLKELPFKIKMEMITLWEKEIRKVKR